MLNTENQEIDYSKLTKENLQSAIDYLNASKKFIQPIIYKDIDVAITACEYLKNNNVINALKIAAIMQDEIIEMFNQKYGNELNQNSNQQKEG